MTMSEAPASPPSAYGERAPSALAHKAERGESPRQSPRAPSALPSRGEGERGRARSAPGERVEPFGVYVHWPFCLAKCPYCDFNSHVRHGGIDQGEFVAAYLAELAHFATLAPGRTVTSIFFGGGTPSLMSASTVAAILDDNREAVDGRAGRRDHARGQSDQRRGGALRGLSRGRRQPRVARRAGARRSEPQSARAHAYSDEALAALAIAKRHFERVSFDLIYARQGQDLRGLARGTVPRAWLRCTITSRSISSPSRPARRSPRGTPPGP